MGKRNWDRFHQDLDKLSQAAINLGRFNKSQLEKETKMNRRRVTELLNTLVEAGEVWAENPNSQKTYYRSRDAELVKASQRMKNILHALKIHSNFQQRLYVESFNDKNLQGFCFTCRFFKPNSQTGKGNRNCQYPGQLSVVPKEWKTGISNAKCNMWELEPDPYLHVFNANIVVE